MQKTLFTRFLIRQTALVLYNLLSLINIFIIETNYRLRV